MVARAALLLCFVHSLVWGADVFAQGRYSAGVTIGSNATEGRVYTIAGVSAHYMVKKNISVGAGFYEWFGDKPRQHEFFVDNTYYIPLNKTIRPYGGIFFKSVIVESYADRYSYGGRGGIVFVSDSKNYVSFGYVYERYASKNAYGSQLYSSYPEIVAGVAF